ncbi:MBL fold metallo-hydrolase [Paenibacillus sp. RUD330]|uniref:MBL fold metallo-hydrolase n=1 Tax=Paenibacillus sp. RUD330 TaxID=2023772 RepID=UPI00197DB83D|nr:MBL fold metallo-hydrolase [Paenibacillus sp. RUD330]
MITRIMKLTFAMIMSIVLLVGCTQTNSIVQQIHGNDNADVKQVAETKSTTQQSVSETTTSSIDLIKSSEESTQSKKQATSPEVLKGNMAVHFIDVGQGASQLIVGPSGKTMLIDAGNNDKEELIVAYLKKQKVNKIDILIGTHPDADHIGGLDAVIDNFDIGKIYMPKVQSNTKTFEDVLLAIQRKGLKITTAKAGLTLEWESNVTVKMIAPVNQYDETNEMSAVIHLSYGSTSFLLTGDAEAGSEKDMISSNANLRADVLMVGHHGSKSSTTQAFLNAVQPTYAVIQVGIDNKYGHPTSEVFQRLNAKKIKIYRNDEQGNIIFTTNGKEITVKTSGGGSPSKSTAKPSEPAAAKPTEVPKKQEDNVVYKNCTAVREAGKAPLHKGDPGYSTKLDRDGDGIACE